MKVLKGIKKVIGYILIVIFYAYALLMTVLLLNFNDYGITKINDTSIVIINDQISNENYKKGDVVFVEEQRLENLKVGQEIFTYRVNTKGNVEIEVGTIGEVYPKDLAISFENGEMYEDKYIIGTKIKKISKIGNVLKVLESKWGFLFAVLVPNFVIFIHQIYNLIVEIKYGDDDDD